MVREYLKKLLPFSLITALVIYLLANKFPHWGGLTIWYGVFLFFLGSSFIFHILTRIDEADSKVFIRKFMLATTLRMLCYLFVITLVFLFKQSMAKHFTLIFLCHYLFFFPFDTIVLFLQARNSKH